ncbi:ethanolamine utilization microcompartment protein EutL [Butyricicoccus sp. Marseille-Q5471]|uniref:ethanolamine utilization microcompartment protein EutL n=1 Tax=Butyricicoccus sp. Marseille-Q5471 TaxID=3039493 RepID=UPI0024BCDD9A|nr:ethanolamine utilization microcompartment protein EutL [Butyricicoccus sp. Marseille-Q5471]
MKRDPVRATVLASKLIPNVSADLAEKLGLSPEQKSLALLTTDCDDVGYTAIDEATKKADVKVVYAKSCYAGAANANTKLAGEFIGILAGPNPAEVKAGLAAAVDMVENEAYFISANEDDTIVYYAQCISRTGSYLSDGAGIAEGEALAYLIAPPLEAVYGIDAALKAADVKMCVLYAPPSETNFGGALLTGSQSACKSACEAFAAAVEFVADNPKV